MAAKLTVRKECLDMIVGCFYNHTDYKVVLAIATQEQLAILKESGVDVFEKDAKEK
jgi:hypothetical protein